MLYTPDKTLNNFTVFVLCCFYKMRCMISESIQKNSSYYYLLWKDLRVLYGDKEYNEFIEKNTGISFQIMFEKENLFELWSQKTVKDKKPVILVCNQLHEEESYYYYGNHHPHFVILNGYNESTDSYYIIDEDYSLNQAKPRWENGSFLYINKEIGQQKLKQLCLDSMNSFYIASLYSNLPAFSEEYLHNLELHTNKLDGNYFAYQYPILNTSVTSCNIKDIGEMYIDYLQQMLKDLDGLYGVMIDNLKTFKYSIVSLRELLRVEDTGIVSPSIFEYSEYKLGKHDFSLQAQIEVFRAVSGSSLHDSLDGSFRAVREKYGFLQKLFFKALISGEPALADKLVNSIMAARNMEKQMYETLIKSLMSGEVNIKPLENIY